MNRRLPLLAPLAVLLLSIGGCAAQLDAASEPSACQAAADHIAACAGDDPAPANSDCNAEEAEHLLDLPCDQITAGLEDTKADRLGLRSAACRWGLFRYCPEARCDALANEPDPTLASMPEGSACLDSVRDLEGCGVCEYYTCQEQRWQCGEDGYLIGFAQKYCRRFRLIPEPRMSAKAQAWLNRTRRCLVLEFEAFDGDDCAALKAFGLASHSDCYTSTGFCDLPISDWFKVLNTVDLRDTDFHTMMTTGVACLHEWLGR